MSQESSSAFALKIALIPDEGIESKWMIGPESFSGEPYPILVEGPVEAAGRFDRVGTTVYFKGDVKAAVKLECSRCLENFVISIAGDVSAVYMPELAGRQESPEKRLGAEDLDVLFYSGDEVDPLLPIRDFVVLETPMRPLCDEKCRGLCPQCGVNLNQAKCACERQPVDSRFAALKKLITNEE